MKLSKSSKGFTLIELLVVVAIIGILAATILVSLGAARGKAKLARAQSELSSMRAAAELYASDHGNSYTGVFTDTDSGMANLIASITNAGYPEAFKNVTDSAWVYAFTAGTTYYCADSNGYAGKTAALASGATACSPIQ